MGVSDLRSRLYLGRVMHRRPRPVRHRLDYRVYSLLLDLDELPDVERRLRLFSHNRFNLFSYHDRDHGPRDGSPIRPWIDARLKEAGCDLGGGRIETLCFPRMLGYAFNPLTIYWCRDTNDRLGAVLYEVKNTFGEQHCYLFPVDADRAPSTPVLQQCDKAFYVSPFMGMDATYRFRLTEPGDRFSVLIRQSYADGETLVAAHTARAAALGDAALLRLLASHPLLTLKVIGGIHWEALKLWRKGAVFHRRPPPPQEPVSVIVPPPHGGDPSAPEIRGGASA